MCPAPVRPPSPASVELLAELRKAEAAYLNATREQWYLAVQRYTDALLRFSLEMARRRRQQGRRAA
jgi:hypothetical protein